MCVLLRSHRINTPLQIETFTRTIPNHILSLFCGGDPHCVFVFSNMSPAPPRCTCTIMHKYAYANIAHTHWHEVHKHSLDCPCYSFPHQILAIIHMAKEDMPCAPKSISSFVILFPVSTICYSMIMIVLFFSRFVFSWKADYDGNPCAVNHMTSSCCRATEAQIDHWLVRDMAAMVSSAPYRMWCLRYWGIYSQSG